MARVRNSGNGKEPATLKFLNRSPYSDTSGEPANQ